MIPAGRQLGPGWTASARDGAGAWLEPMVSVTVIPNEDGYGCSAYIRAPRSLGFPTASETALSDQLRQQAGVDVVQETADRDRFGMSGCDRTLATSSRSAATWSVTTFHDVHAAS